MKLRFALAAVLCGAGGCASDSATSRGSLSGLSAGGTGDGGTAATATAAGTLGGTQSGGGSAGVGCMGAPFRVEVNGSWLAGVAVAAGHVVAVGARDGLGARLFAIDPCDGSMVEERTLQFEANPGTKLYAVRPVGEDVLVAGSTPVGADPRQGYYARVAVPTLATVWDQEVSGSSGADEIYALDVASSGTVFLAGYTDPGTRTPWLAAGDAQGQACSFPVDLGQGVYGDVGAVAFSQDGAQLYAVASTDGDAFFLRFAAGCGCPCTPEVAVPLDLPFATARTVVLGLADAGGQVLAAGGYLKEGTLNDMVAFVAAVAPASGTVSAVWTKDPTTLGDGWVAARIADDRLLVAGGDGWNGVSETFEGANAWGAAFDLPLTNQSTPVWEVHPENVDVVTAVAYDGERDAVVFAGNRSAEGVVIACTGDGVCP